MTNNIYLTLVNEIFDHKENLTWQSHGDFQMAAFSMGGRRYQIQIQTIQRVPYRNVKELTGKKIGDVSFMDITDNKISDDSFATSKEHQSSSIKVYSTILNGIASKFDEYDAYHFEADRRHSNSNEEFNAKLHIYESLVKSLKSKHAFHYYERKESGSKYFLISKIKLENESERDSGFIHPLKESMAMVGLDVSGFNL